MKGNTSMLIVGKCLTIGRYPEQSEKILKAIKSNNFNWEEVVLTASNQFVLPAWFIQMKNAGLTDFMPEELKLHVAELTNLNRERNIKIIHQADEIAKLLNTNGIAPVFLKGTAHLLLGLYTDPAERMIGDIDFLVKDDEVLAAAECLQCLGFQPETKYNAAVHSEMKHFPGLVNYDYPAAIEIHREVMDPPNDRKFKAENVLRDKQRIPSDHEIYAPSFAHLIVHNMLNAQINDKSYAKASVLLRQTYDLFLLSERENPQNVLEAFDKFRKESGAWLAVSSLLLGNPGCLQHKKTSAVKAYLNWFIFMQQHPRIAAVYRQTFYLSWRFWRYVMLPARAVFDPSVRAGIFLRLTDKSWYGKHINSYQKHFK